MQENLRFPKDFLWGVATSAAQIEGASFDGGKGPTIWDVFSSVPGKIQGGDTPDPGCEFCRLYPEDIARMKELGIDSFRFSFSWARILPEGTGRVNPEGIAYYKKMIRCLKENGIIPNATMYHWDLPYVLQCKGGFGNREMVSWFREYVNVLLENFGEDIPLWSTFNEPIAVYVGYGMGGFAPGLQDERYARQALHHLLLCHGEAVKLFREKQLPDAQIGIVVDIWHHYPARDGNLEDIALAAYNNEIMGYGMFLHPLFLGDYSAQLKHYFAQNDVAPRILPGDMETITQPLDFYGLNFYNGLYDNAEKERTIREGGNYQDTPEFHPEALFDVLHMLRDKYKVTVPVYITENGMGQENSLGKEKLLDDRERISYVSAVLYHLHRAIRDGADVRGYYLWSLLDNFEWSAGYSMRYGLYYVDFETQERLPKKSAAWYRDFIARQKEENHDRSSAGISPPPVCSGYVAVPERTVGV